MYLTRLSLTNFRLFSRLDLNLPRRIVLFSGSNAQGKTSILEAVAFLANFSSFHASSEKQLINFNLPVEPLQVGRIVGEFIRHEKRHTLEVRLIQQFNGNSVNPRFSKELLIDGVKKRQSELYGQFNAVTFLPQMASIIEGGPAERRIYLDEILSQVENGYAGHLLRYNKALTRRNALLKSLADSTGDHHQLDAWDGMMALHGAFIINARVRVLKELENLTLTIHPRLTRNVEVLRFLYQPSFDPIPSPAAQPSLPVLLEQDRSGISILEIENLFYQKLQKLHREDIGRGMTGCGPHRDEFRFLSNRIDLGNYGSRGQTRTALLSLKLAEVQWMKQRTGEWPVLLLDEIMAELDPQRREDLQIALGEVEQALLTSTDPEMFSEDFLARQEIFQVINGVLVKK